MKRIAILLAFLATTASAAFAQDNEVKGFVYDYESAEPLFPAALQVYTVSGKDTTYVTGTSTEENGSFKMNMKAGSYLLRASYMGYVNTEKTFTVRAGQTTDLGKVTMKQDAISLSQVNVTAALEKVVIKNDTVEFNSEAFRLPDGSSVEDLVRKLPGVQITSDGQITVNGKNISRILVNGKEFFNGDNSVALQQLTADMIEKVKAYDKQSDLARQTGIDDGNEETVLDLTVKKGMAKGWFGDFRLGYGQPMQETVYEDANLYQAQATLNRFDEQKQFTLTGSAAQTAGGMSGGGMGMGGGVGFGGRGGGGMGGGGGLSTRFNGGANFAMNLGEETTQDNYLWEVGGSINWSHNSSESESKSNSETWYTGNTHTWSNREGGNENSSSSLSGQMRIEWNKDRYTSMIFTPSVSYSKSESSNNSKSVTFIKDPYLFAADPIQAYFNDTTYYNANFNPNNLVLDPLANYLDSIKEAVRNSQFSNSSSNSQSYSTNGTLQFTRRFGNRGRNLTFRGTYRLSKSESESFSRNQQKTAGLIPGSPLTETLLLRYAPSPSNNIGWSTQLTYSEPIATGEYLQASYEFSYSKQNSDRSTYDISNTAYGNPDWVFEDNEKMLNTQLTTNSYYYNLDQTLQVQYRKNATDSKYNFTVGLSVLPQYSKMNYSGMGLVDTLLTRTVFNFTPTLQYRYRWTRQQQINVSYNGRSSQPQMSQLLDITDDSNPLSIQKGNPGLKPTFSNTFQVSYNNYIPSTMTSYNTRFSIGNTMRSIQNKTTLNSNFGTTSQPVNMDGFAANWNTSLNAGLNVTLPDDRFSVSADGSGSFRHQEGWASIQGQDAQLRKTNTTGANGRLTGEYRGDILSVQLLGNLNYNHSVNDLQPDRNMDTYDFNYGTNFTAMFPWRNARLASDIQMQSRRGYSADMDTDELVWNASGSFSFLKGNKATLQIAAYDILHQRSTVSRSMSTTSRTDSQNTNITSYFQVTLIYRLSMFGDRGARGGRGGMGGFGGGMGGMRGGMGGFGGGMGGFGGGMMF